MQFKKLIRFFNYGCFSLHIFISRCKTKRRLIKHDFLKVLAKVLRKDGTVYISTDWENYAESIEEEIANTKEHFSFQQISNDGMPITRFQQRAINEGRHIHTFLLKVLKK